MPGNSRLMIAVGVFAVLVGCLFASLISAQNAKPCQEKLNDLDFEKVSDLKTLARLRESAIFDLTATLAKYDGKHPDRTSRVIFAAQQLVELRADREEVLTALCKNINLRDIILSHNSPLDGYVAANALVALGGPKAASAIFEELRETHQPRTVLIFAFTLNSMDAPEVSLARVRLAVATETKRPRSPSGPNKDYLANLRQIEEWLRRPAFFEDGANWPIAP